MKNYYSKITKYGILLLFCLCFTVNITAEKRYYLVANGTLPAGGVDYRLGLTRTLDITPCWDWGYPAGTVSQTNTHSIMGITGENYLDFNISIWWWWRFTFLTNSSLDLGDVDNTSKLHFALRTTETGQNITITIYGAPNSSGVQTEGSYVFNYTTLPLSSRDGSWHTFDIPMTEFFGQTNPLNFAAPVTSKYFSVAGGGSQNTMIALDDVYITGKTGGTTRVNDLPAKLVNIHFTGNIFHIDNLPAKSTVKIITTNGKIISTYVVNGYSFEKEVNLAKGVYFVEISGESGPKSTIKIVR